MADNSFAPAREGGTTLYGRVYHHLKTQIESREYEAGAQLPSENQLCVTFRVSRPVVRQALKLLEDQGFVYKVHGRGTFVAEPGMQSQLMAVAVGPERDTMRYRQRLRTTVVVQRLEDANAAVAREMRLGLGTPVVHLRRVRYLDGEPLAVLESYLPEHLAPGLVEEALVDESLYELLESRHNRRITRLRRSIGVGALDDDLAHHLGKPVGTPYLRVASLAMLADGEIIETSVASYRGDRITLTTELAADDTPAGGSL